MRILYVMTGIGVLPERRENVSGHVQIPLKTCELMKDIGFEVSIVATAQADGTAMPACLPEGVVVDLVSDGRRRGQLGKQNAGNGIRIFSVIKQIWQTVAIIRERNPDIIHVFGFERMATLGGILKLLVRRPIVVTILGKRPRRGLSWLYRRLDKLLTLTDSVASDWSAIGSDLQVTRPGVVRSLHSKHSCSDRNRVLFWREASELGGADLCLETFEELAEKYPRLKFCFAVRHNKNEVKGLNESAQKHSNIEVFRFPYGDGVTLEGLIEESICVVLPYRALSIEPQMTVVETLAVGCPVITTNIRCLAELVDHGNNGLVIEPNNAMALSEAVENVISKKIVLWDRDTIAVEFERIWSWGAYSGLMKKIYLSYNKGSAVS